MDSKIWDVKIPFEEDGSGGLKLVTGEALASQRIIEGYKTTPGDICHRPLWGANLEDFSNHPPTTSKLQQLRNQATRFLRTLPFLDAFEVLTEHDGDSVEIETNAVVNGRAVRVPEHKV